MSDGKMVAVALCIVLPLLLLAPAAGAGPEPLPSPANVRAAVAAGAAAAVASLRDDGSGALVARCDYHLLRGEWYDYERLWHTAQTIKALVSASALLGNRSDLLAAATRAGRWWRAQRIAAPPALAGLVNSTDVLPAALGCITDACDGTQDLSDVSDSAYGIFALSAATGDPSFADAASASARWQLQHMTVPDAPGLFWNVLNKTRRPPAPVTDIAQPFRTQIEGSLFLQAYRHTGDPRLRAAFLAQADATVAHQDAHGLWMLWTPNDNATGQLHPRYNLWYAFSLVDAFEATQNASYLAAAVKTAAFYAAHVQRRDGTIFYMSYVNGSVSQNDLCGSAVGFLLHLAVRLLQVHAVARDPAAVAALQPAVARSVAWLLANQYPTTHPDPNLRGAFLEIGFRHKPWYLGPHSKAVIHRDLGTSFALPALVAFAEFAGSEARAIWRNETVEAPSLNRRKTDDGADENGALARAPQRQLGSVNPAADSAAADGSSAAASSPNPLCSFAPRRPRFRILGPPIGPDNIFTHDINDVKAIFGWTGLYHVMHMGGDPRRGGWCHLVSSDLVRWRRLLEALAPGPEFYDYFGVWDGAISVPADGSPPFIMYDCVPRAVGNASASASMRRPEDSDPPVIALARATDPSDAQLRRWVKDPSNPVTVSGPIRFESPSNVWWNTRTGAFNMDMVLLRNLSGEGGTTARYTTRDPAFRNWTLADASFFAMRGGGGGIFLPIFPRGPNATLSRYTHLMQVYRPSHAEPGNSHDGASWFVLGAYDETREAFENASAPQPLDFGTYAVYSQLGWAGGRLLHISWLPDPARLTNYSQLTTVRQITFDAELQMLRSNPVPEQLTLRGELIINDYSRHIPPGLPSALSLLPADPGPALDLEIALQLPECSGADRCPVFGVSLLDAPGRPGIGALVTLQQLPGGAGPSGRTTDMLNMSLAFGLTEAAYAFPLAPFETSGANGGDTQAVDIRVLVDASVVEVFVLGGRGVASAAGLPAGNAAHAFAESGGLLLKAAGYRVGCGWEDVAAPAERNPMRVKTDDSGGSTLTGSAIFAASPSRISPGDLTCEYHKSPIIDVVAPRFSWVPTAVDAAARGLVQTAYQLQVSEVEPSGEHTLLWDSGAVESSRSLHVELSETVSLDSDAAYSWRVRLWSHAVSAAQPSQFSANATFGTALLDQKADWKAPWVVSDWPQQQLRLRFSLPAGKEVARARAYVAAGGYSVVFVNGDNANARNGNEELGPWTTWSTRVLYKAYDVAPSLREGAENVVGVRLGRGMYANYAHFYDWNNSIGWNASNSGQPGSFAASKQPCTQNKSGKIFNNCGVMPGGLRLQLNVRFTDGTGVVVGEAASDWEATSGPVGWNDVYTGEFYDGMLHDKHWATPEGNASGWSSSSVHLLSPDAASARGALSVDRFTPIRGLETRWPVRLEGGGGSWLFWFAENFVGRSVLHNLDLPRGTAVTLGHAMQMVCPNRTVALVGCTNGSLFVPDPNKPQVDRFVLAGSGNETVTTSFTYHGYQFVRLEGWPASATPPTLATLSGVVMHSDNAPTARLTFPETKGGQLLRKISEAMVRTLLSNHFSVETDGLSERVGWTGDSQATCESAVRSLNMAAFYEKWMQDIQDAQNCAGMKRTPGCAPGSLSPSCPYVKHDPPYDPTWVSNYAQEVALLHKYHGDKRVVARHYDSIKAYVEYARTLTSCPNCDSQTRTNTQAAAAPHLPYYGWSGDWMEWRDLNINIASSGAISSSMHFILDLETLRDFALILGKTDDAANYTEMVVQYRQQFNDIYLGYHNRTERGGGDSTKLSYCAPHFLQGGRGDYQNKTTCHTQAQQIIPLFSSSAPIGRMPPLAPRHAEEDVVATLLAAIKCPVAPQYADPGCAQNMDPQLKAGVWNQGMNFSGANLTAWTECWQQGPNCGVSAPGRMNTGLVTTSKILPTLSRHNQSELALGLAMVTELPSWGYIIVNGGTTMWEGWSGLPYSGGLRSCHNQHQDAGGLQWFHDSLVGFQQGQTGTAFESIVVAPAITTSLAIPSMAGVYETPRGVVEVSWEYVIETERKHALTLNVTTPPNTNTTTRLPGRGRAGAPATRVTEGFRTVLWQRDAPPPPTLDFETRWLDDGAAVEVVHGSGTYRFRVEYA
jgi:sucrose-6-phosphate hydrolase SacC (GH32 family)